MIPVSAEAMRELDRLAAEKGISTEFLMENAGMAVSKKAIELLTGHSVKSGAIFCGKGNNGGDGFVAGRRIMEKGFNVRAYVLGRQDDIKKDAANSLRKFVASGGRVEELANEDAFTQLENRLAQTLVIDALLGTGFSGPVSGSLERLIKLLNASSAPILAVDIPSGLNSTTGDIDPVAIMAKWTITFALPKKGLYEKSGPSHTGELFVADIGFPESLVEKAKEFEKAYEQRHGKPR